MSFINKKITSPANDGLSVFINKFIDNITTDSNYIDLIETNIDTKEDSEVWYIKFLLYGKIIIQMQQVSNRADVLLYYSIDNGANFTNLNNGPTSVGILNNNIYEIDYLLIENPLCCYLDIIYYSSNYLYSNSSSSANLVNFLSINKNDKVLITGGNNSIDCKLNSSNTNFLCYNEATNYKLYNGLGYFNIPSKIFYMPKIITSDSSTQKYVFSCDDYMLDVNLVEKFSKLTINGLKYFSLSSNTLIQYE